MPLRIIIAGILALMLFGAYFAAAEQDLSALIKTLQQQIQALQQQLAELQTQEAKSAAAPFAANLRRGSAGEEVARLQEFLKKRPEFYPEGLVTGYFGVATERAVKRFQKTYGIDALGIVGPKTRAKLNELLVAKPTPPAQEPAPALTAPEPPAISITPAPEPTPATTTPSSTATTTPAAPAAPPVVLPTQAQLGLATVSFFGWGQDYLKVQFTHEPTSYTRSYAVYLRAPNQSGDTKFGPYALPTVGSSSTSTDATAFQRAGPSSWEWIKPVNLASASEGVYQISVTAVGDGNVESASSGGRIATLYPKALFEDLLEGAPVRAVNNLTVTRFPLTMRIANFYSDIYYYYTIYDGKTRVWDSAYLTSASSARIEAVFQNTNGYPFASGRTYRLRVDIFDNNTGKDSAIKQKSNEIIFTYSPY